MSRELEGEDWKRRIGRGETINFNLNHKKGTIDLK